MYKRNTQILVLVILAFFISGASALIYQILWVKILTLTFGSTTLAVSTILASFMGGLALGSYLMSKYSYKIKKVLQGYAVLELLIGLYALLVPFLFQLVDMLYRTIWPIIGENDYLVLTVRFLIAILVLLTPTSLMGATLPLLVKYYVNRDDVIVKYVSILYGVNTLGAVVGAILCGFFLLETFGIFNTNLIAVSVSFLAAFIALSVDKKAAVIEEKESIVPEQKELAESGLSFSEKFVLTIMFLSGATAMVYEIIWARQLVLIFGSTTYAYTTMLVVFLIGIGLGSLLVNNKFSNPRRNIYYFGIFEVAIGVLVILGSYYYRELFYIQLVISNAIGGLSSLLPMIIISSMLILPPALFFGMTFPLSIKLFTTNHQLISRKTGTIYSYNTFGCIVGSVLTALVLIPIFGLKWSLILAAILNIVLGGVYLYYNLESIRQKNIALAASLSIVVLAFLMPVQWDKPLLSAGFYANKAIYYDVSKDINRKSFYNNMESRKIVYYKEGYHSTVGVAETFDGSKQYSLFNNGKVDASTTRDDMRTQVGLGYIPMLLKKKVDDILIVGMGSGITLSFVEKTKAKNIEIVELEEAVLDARKWFSKRYGDPLKDKRVKVIVDDARNYLRVTDKKYDFIISEPSNVWVSGVSSLFTKDYYNIIKKKLKTDGCLVQWIQLYGLNPEVIMSVIKALKEEFKYVYIFHTKTGTDFIFLASQKPIKYDLDLFDKLFQEKSLRNDISEIFNINDKYELFNLFVGNTKILEDKLEKIKSIIPTNTDDNSFLEFNATRSFLNMKTGLYKTDPSQIFLILKGVSKKDIINPPADFYKQVVIALSSQYNRAKNIYPELPSESPFYLKQMLVYAKKYYDEFPNSPDSMVIMGTVSLDNNLTADGIQYLKMAAKKGSRDPVCYSLLTRYYNNLLFPADNHYKPEIALQYAKKFVELAPDDNTGYFLLGLSYCNNGKFAEAVKNLNRYYNMQIKSGNVPDPKFFFYYGKASLKYKI